jgi:hypothetical protein
VPDIKLEHLTETAAKQYSIPSDSAAGMPQNDTEVSSFASSSSSKSKLWNFSQETAEFVLLFSFTHRQGLLMMH